MVDYSKFIRENLSFFTVAPFYIKERTEKREDGTLNLVKEWSIYEAKTMQHTQPIYILDTDGFVKQREKRLSVKSLDEDSVKRYFNTLPKPFQEKIKAKLESWGYDTKNKDITAVLMKSGILTAPVPRLTDIEGLKEIDWAQVVKDITEFKGGELDERIVLLRKCTTGRGVTQKLNGHALVSSQANTGKSDYYDTAGKLVQKATANTYLGFAKSPKEVFRGSVDETELPQALDQLESQSCPQIFRYLLQIMERGEAIVDTGATDFPVRSKSVFIVLSNPIGYSVDSAKSFWGLVEHLSPNPALGRRFGLIVFGTDFQEVKRQLSPTEMEEWEAVFTFFRAVEEYAYPKIREIYQDKEVWNWVDQPIVNYVGKGEALVEPLESSGLKDFLLNHLRTAKARAYSLHLQERDFQANRYV